MILEAFALIPMDSVWAGLVAALLPAVAKMYLGYQFRPLASAPSGKRGLTVTGQVHWALSSEVGVDAAAVQQYLATWEERGYKMALLVRKGQRVEALAYAAEGGGQLALRPDARVAAAADKALGTPPGSSWVGYVSVGGRRKATLVDSHVVSFEVSLTLTPALEGPQVVPVLSRHRKGSFADGYMPGLWVLPKGRGARKR